MRLLLALDGRGIDALLFEKFATTTLEAGLNAAYLAYPGLNHPPTVMHPLAGLVRMR